MAGVVRKGPAKAGVKDVERVLNLCVKQNYLPCIVFAFSKNTCENLIKATRGLPSLAVGFFICSGLDFNGIQAHLIGCYV
jgi:superfamily II RNA helicase